MTRLNHRLRDLLLDEVDMVLLNSVSNQLEIKNTILARLLLHNSLMQLKANGIDNFQLAIVGLQDKSAWKRSKNDGN